MSFFALPPEINSLRMYSGVGSSPMLQVASVWNGLASELSTAAQSFSSVTSGLAGQAWQGAASQAMTALAAPYAGWLSAAANQASEAGAQAMAVANAFEAALASTVHPLAVDANRNGLVQLVMSNLFGQNWPAIAATESYYEEMWAQDVSAMVGYHGGASTAAAQLLAGHAAMPSLPGMPGMPSMPGGSYGGSPSSVASPAGAGGGAAAGSAAGVNDVATAQMGAVGAGGSGVGAGNVGFAAAAGSVSGADPSAGGVAGASVAAGSGSGSVAAVNPGSASTGLMGSGGMAAMIAASVMRSTASGGAPPAVDSMAVKTPQAPVNLQVPEAEAEAVMSPAATTPLAATQESAAPAAETSALEPATTKSREQGKGDQEGERLAMEAPLAQSPVPKSTRRDR